MSLFKRHKISIDLSRKKTHSWYEIAFKMRNTLFIICALIALLFAYHYYRKYAELRDVVKNVPAVSQNSDPAASVISAVDKLILLPPNEQPVIAQVTDIRPLLGNNFFRNAVLGDDVLVYCRSELSILYSPSRNKIIEVLPQALLEACKTAR